MTLISSLQNATVKELVKLRECSRERKSQGMFTIEGGREWARALQAGYQCERVFVCQELLSGTAKETLALHADLDRIEITEAVFRKLVVREGSDGIVALMRCKASSLSSLTVEENSLYLVVEQVEKPGNFGALARTADGVGVDAIIVLDPTADLYNPHSIRASVGALFARPLFTCTHEEFVTFCKKTSTTVFTASPHAAKYYFEEDFSKSTALVLGSEAHGLSAFWQKVTTCPLKIPMNGLADSLNVSVAGAVILYEVLRQRTLRV